MTLQLTALSGGWLTMPGSFLMEGESDAAVEFPVCAFLIEHPNGAVLFDSGISPHTYENLQFLPNCAARLDETGDLKAQLARIGRKPNDIRFIVNSHLHTDHCGANALFPDAEVLVQAPELAAAEAGLPGYDAREWAQGGPRRAVEGEVDLFGDGAVTLFPTYGHTPGHQSAKVRLDGEDVVLAGDCCYFHKTLITRRLPMFAADKDAQHKALDQLAGLRARGARIVYGHDARQWACLPVGRPLAPADIVEPEDP